MAKEPILAIDTRTPSTSPGVDMATLIAAFDGVASIVEQTMTPSMVEVIRKAIAPMKIEPMPIKLTEHLQRVMETSGILDVYKQSESARIASMFKAIGDTNALRISEQFASVMTPIDTSYAKHVAAITKAFGISESLSESLRSAMQTAVAASVAMPTIEPLVVESVAHAAEEAPSPEEWISETRGMSNAKRAELQRLLIEAAGCLLGVVGALAKIGELSAAQSVFMLAAALISLSKVISADDE